MMRRLLRTGSGAMLAATLLAAGGQALAQGDAASTPPAAIADPFKFSTDAAFMLYVVKVGETENFELLWSVIRSRLAASSRTDLKALGASLTIYRMGAPAGSPLTEVTYLFLADPATKTASYSVAPFLLFESGLFGRAEADEMFKLLQGTLVRVSPSGLDTIK